MACKVLTLCPPALVWAETKKGLRPFTTQAIDVDFPLNGLRPLKELTEDIIQLSPEFRVACVRTSLFDFRPTIEQIQYAIGHSFCEADYFSIDGPISFNKLTDYEQDKAENGYNFVLVTLYQKQLRNDFDTPQ